ncbi:hypothetical protein M0802_005838 [Mischocyttarus mexicanus]|nr:hypothetical protein M0802_005838 [Mischocyttarus mexicanus]
MELVQAFLDYLLTWFSYLAINVWGGIVDELLVCCNFVNDISLCCGNSKYLFIFISGHDMETFMLNYAEDCDDKKILFNDNRTWYKTGKEVDKRRLPICRVMTIKKFYKNKKFYHKIKEVVKCLEQNTLFCMITVNTVERKPGSERCLCNLLSSNCYTLWIDCPSSENKELLKLTYMLCPEVSTLKLNSYTYSCKYSPKGFYCPEIHFKMDVPFLKLNSLKTYMEQYFELVDPSRYCLIIWCREAKQREFENELKNISQHYRGNRIPVWGGIGDGFVICNKSTGMYGCCTSADFIFLFLNGRDMEARTIIFDHSCTIQKLIGRKFKHLRRSMTLKNYSIAFMYTSHFCPKICKMEVNMFKVFFPNVKLYHNIGKQPIGGMGLEEVFSRIVIPVIPPCEKNSVHTSFISWLVFGQNEIKSRGPIGYLETIKKNSDQTVLNINKKIIESCRIKPTLYIFLTDHNSVKDIIRNSKFNLAYYTDSQKYFDTKFPDSRVPIWGGVIDTLSVCKSFLLKTQCNMRADLINIIISGQNMSMWNLLLDDDCHSKKKLKKKFAELKNNVKLKDHTIGFIFTPIKRYEKLNTLESTVFAKYFPEVQLIHIYGHAAFIGNGFKELYDMMTKQLPMEDEGCTTIMILTYY